MKPEKIWQNSNTVMSEEYIHKLRQEIESYIPFAVTEEEQPVALQLVARYRDNELVLRLLHDYYTALPDACEEAATAISEIESREGVHLFVLCCTSHNWLYAVTMEDVALVAEYGTEVPKDLALFFGYAKVDDFLKGCPPAAELKEYDPKAAFRATHCPACGVAEGENHLAGCVVEVCPWCDGQLQSCNCRFEKLDLAEIKTKEEVEEFLEILEEKGRIPFQKDQAPSYPGTSRGLDN